MLVYLEKRTFIFLKVAIDNITKQNKTETFMMVVQVNMRLKKLTLFIICRR